jgi:CRISPR/Cas system CSM-associated protein Csm3 (group 7 of RAMP superfamily)
MIQALLVIHCDSEWLIAGGDSTLGTADMAPMRDAEGLPFVPGRTIRGLLREAMSSVDDAFARDRSDVQAGQTERLFGTRKQDGDAGEPRDGSVRIGDALLPQEVAGALDRAKGGDPQDIVHSIRRTALDGASRSAKKGSLREMEVVMAGLQLAADIRCETEADLRWLAFAAGLVRSFGHSRSRGLGRCRLEVRRDGAVVNPGSIKACTEGGAR